MLDSSTMITLNLVRNFLVDGVKKKDDGGTTKDIRQKYHDVTSCQIYDKECETTSITEPKIFNQDERTRLNKINDRADNAPDTKFHLVEYIKECSKEQQQILSTDIRKNQKILDVPVKRK